MQKFQAYVRALELPEERRPKAFETLRRISGVQSGPAYRLQSAKNLSEPCFLTTGV